MAKLNVDTTLIETLAELLERTGLKEIEVSEGEARIRVVREPHPTSASVPVPTHQSQARPDHDTQTAASRPARPADRGQPGLAEAEHPGAVQAPMVGTVYLTPEPGAPPFVTAGAEVREGATLLIIEAMKVMNPIRAPKSGRIVQIMVANGDPVEYGELLLIIE